VAAKEGKREREHSKTLGDKKSREKWRSGSLAFSLRQATVTSFKKHKKYKKSLPKSKGLET
jgi:hypothetical protein